MKFLHVGDIHLGVEPDKDREWSKARQQEIWDSVARVVDVCNAEEVDLLLLAGDIFHSQPLVRQIKDLDYRLSNLENTKVVMLAGNHDYIRENSKYGNYEWSSNVTMLSGKEMNSVYFEELNTEIYGFSYHSREITGANIDLVKPVDKSKINILLAHGGDEKHMPINFKSLQYAGFHYIALGHIHLPQIIVPDMIAYAGVLEPIDKTETGDRGYILGDIINGKTKINFNKSNIRSYLEKTIKVTPNMSNAELQDEVKKIIENEGRENIYIFRLKGYSDPDIEIESDILYKLGNIVEIDDQTEPDYDFERLYEVNKDNMIGMFIGDLLPEVKAGKLLEKKALYYGLKALLAAKEV
ncbi:MAG: hypothetical protein K0R15_2477 [Clostridiales bacterium]|jgi:DNA repair exonuclease SbcCD nuclease subunit|nr:hypothetical protein [Clostridiales bacterium]